MEISVLMKKDIFWKIHPTYRRYWYIEAEGRLILLRINNFPEELLFTIINGLDIVDIEDTPSNWTLENLGKK